VLKKEYTKEVIEKAWPGEGCGVLVIEEIHSGHSHLQSTPSVE